MKAIVVVACILFTSCKRSSETSIRNFIPGTYIKSVNSDYSKGYDTLIIEVMSEEGNNYRIKRHTGYQRIRNGKLLSKEKSAEEWIGIYNNDEKVLHETRYGKIISIDPGNMKLYLGNSYYIKLN